MSLSEYPANVYLMQMMGKWHDLQQVPNIFAYKLDITESKYLPGKYKFYSEYNPKRTALRRPPQTITSLDPQFNEENFNFKKVAAQEVLLKLKYEDDTVSFIINNSPLTPLHTLICPNVEKSLPQRITLNILRFCVDFILSLEGKGYFRIGYNSPGALASVNHLHLHLMLVKQELYIDRAKLKYLATPDIYRLDPSMPTEAICFVIDGKDSKTDIEFKIKKLYTFLIWLCDNSIPHNVFMTPKFGPGPDFENVLKIFVYVREKIHVVKDLYTVNLGFCELSGYVPLGSKELYDNLTDEEVIAKINSESGAVYNKIYEYFKES